MTAIVYNSGLKVPGPASLPILGPFVHTLRFAKDSVGYTQKLFQTYGPIVSLTQGGGTNLQQIAGK